MSQSLEFDFTLFSTGFGLIVIVATAVLCWFSWQRTGFTRGAGLLEVLRLVLVTMVVITLCQPEWLQLFKPAEEPTLAVVWDNTVSMNTRDVLDPEKPSARPRTRAEWVQSLLAEENWKPLADRIKVVFEPLASDNMAGEGTDINAALNAARQRHPNLRGVVLISDADWNLGEPPVNAATQLRMNNIPVFAMCVGSEERLPDVEIVSVDAPTFGVVGKAMRIPFVVRNWLARDYEVTATLTASDGKQLTRQLRVPAMSTIDDAVVWRPENKGDFTLTLNIPPHPSELIEENNTQTVPIQIREEALKVLLIESFPRWEYRYLRNALERDPGVEVACLLFHPDLPKLGGGRGYLPAFPETQDQLSQYDVIFLGDVGVGDGQLTPEQCRLIKGLVQSQASGLILMPGLRGNHFSLMSTELSDLYPVLLDEAQPRGWGSRLPAQFELTESGRRSLLTKLAETEQASAQVWESLPGFQWYAPVLRGKAGSEVLAVHKSETSGIGRVPLLVTKTFGTGKVLFMGTDAAWRWREGVEDKYHYRFWGQVARWMAYQRNMAEGKTMRLFYAPDRPQSGGVVTLNANVMSATGEPLQDGTVVVQIESPAGKTETVRLLARGEEWGLFTGRFTPEEHGDYKITMTCRENGATLNTTLSVQGVSRERLGQPARPDVLKEIASVTRGRLAEAGEISKLVDEIAALPEPDPITHRLPIWCHPVWAGLLVVMMGVFWTGRKLIGVI